MHFLWQSGSGKIADENLHGGCGLHQESYEVHIQNGGGSIGNPECRSGSTGIAGGKQYMKCRNWCSSFPKKYRLVVYLYYSADMKLTEIAECLHLSVNTVKTPSAQSKITFKGKLEVIGYER